MPGPFLVPTRLRSNHRPLGDGWGSGDTRALLVVFNGERSRDVLRICTEACHRCQHDADRLEEFQKRGDGHGLLKSGMAVLYRCGSVPEAEGFLQYVGPAVVSWICLLSDVVMSVLKGVQLSYLAELD
jgi:hypothetical protein